MPNLKIYHLLLFIGLAVMPLNIILMYPLSLSTLFFCIGLFFFGFTLRKKADSKSNKFGHGVFYKYAYLFFPFGAIVIRILVLEFQK